MSELNFSQAEEILAIWTGRTVNVRVYGMGSGEGGVLAMLNGKLSEHLGNEHEWATYAVGDPSNRTVFTLHESDFQRAEVHEEGGGYLELYFDTGSITVGLDQSSDDFPEDHA